MKIQTPKKQFEVNISPDKEFDRLQTMIDARNIKTERSVRNQPYIKPKLASTLIILRGSKGKQEVLMGKRNKALKFMPGALVFPGGRVDRTDHFINAATPLKKTIEEKLQTNVSSKSANVAKALGVAAIRELWEETGLIIGKKSQELSKHADWSAFTNLGMGPALASLKILGRAVTPPGNVRRFDTWFFITNAEEINHTPVGGFNPSGELEELQWITPEAAIGAQTREITRVLLMELINRLRIDEALSANVLVPSYRYVGKRFVREVI